MKEPYNYKEEEVAFQHDVLKALCRFWHQLVDKKEDYRGEIICMDIQTRLFNANMVSHNKGKCIIMNALDNEEHMSSFDSHHLA